MLYLSLANLLSLSQVQIKYFNRLVRTIFRESLETITLSILDENAFIVYSNEEDYNPAKVNRYFDWASEISNFILTKTKYYNRKGVSTHTHTQ